MMLLVEEAMAYRVGLTDTACPGYATFFPKVGEYNLKKAPVSWTKVVAMRHALTQFPDATYFWYVDIDTFIMNPALSIERDIMGPANLEQKMIVDHPVVPPDSIIHTFSHLKAEDVHFVVAQDKDGLATNSWLVRNSEWSRYFLDTWFDPTYRSYNFQKAETHALVSPHPCLQKKERLLTRCRRNILCSGTLRSCPTWPSFLSVSSTHTISRIRARNTPQATCLSVSRNAPSRLRNRPARPKRSRTHLSGDRLIEPNERRWKRRAPACGVASRIFYRWRSKESQLWLQTDSIGLKMTWRLRRLPFYIRAMLTQHLRWASRSDWQSACSCGLWTRLLGPYVNA